MRSEQQHIDDFFRNKEEEWVPDNSRLHAHWQQMNTLLTTPGAQPAGNNIRIRSSRRIIKYLGGFTVITVITLVTVNLAKNKKTLPHKPNTTQATIAAVKPAAPKRNTATTTVVAASTKAAPATTIETKKAIAVKRSPANPVAGKEAENINIPEYMRKKKSAEPVENTPVKRVPKKRDATKMISEFYGAFKKTGQEFFIQSGRDTSIAAKEGTRLAIAANSFVTKKGTLKSGTIKLVITEYYTYDDIVAAKLSTTSNGQQLVSGGMIEVKATSAEEELQVAPNKTIGITMPAVNYDKRMQLFTGGSGTSSRDYTNMDSLPAGLYDTENTSAINWIPAGNQKSIFTHDKKQLVDAFDLTVDPLRVNYGKKTTARFLISNDLNMTKEEVKELLQKRYNGYYDKIKIRRAGKNTRNTVIDTVSMDLVMATRLKLISKEDSARYAEKFKKESTATAANNKATDFSSYQFETTSLGWINCDRFASDPAPKINFTLNLGEGNEAENFVSQLVFTRYKSIMNGVYYGNKIQFRNIPENEAVKVVSVGVKDGKIVTCIQSMTATGKEIKNLDFEETTPAEFRKKLESLLVTQ